MAEVENNPAGRLHAILTRAKEIAREPANRASAGILWGLVFQVVYVPSVGNAPPNPLSSSEQLEVISRLIELQKLVEETEESLLKVEGLTEKYFRPFERIRPLTFESLAALGSDVSGSLAVITDGDMTVLEFCSEKLEGHHPEVVVDKAELILVLSEVTALFEEVKVMADLDEDLHAFILDGLESIRRGISEFRIRGPERLRETLAEIVGGLAVNWEMVEAAREDESMQKFGKLFYRLAAAVRFGADATRLLAAVKIGLLPGGG